MCNSGWKSKEDLVTGALLIGVVGLYYFLVLKLYYSKKGEV